MQKWGAHSIGKGWCSVPKAIARAYVAICSRALFSSENVRSAPVIRWFNLNDSDGAAKNLTLIKTMKLARKFCLEDELDFETLEPTRFLSLHWGHRTSGCHRSGHSARRCHSLSSGHRTVKAFIWISSKYFRDLYRKGAIWAESISFGLSKCGKPNASRLHSSRLFRSG